MRLVGRRRCRGGWGAPPHPKGREGKGRGGRGVSEEGARVFASTTNDSFCWGRRRGDVVSALTSSLCSLCRPRSVSGDMCQEVSYGVRVWGGLPCSVFVAEGCDLLCEVQDGSYSVLQASQTPFCFFSPRGAWALERDLGLSSCSAGLGVFLPNVSLVFRSKLHVL